MKRTMLGAIIAFVGYCIGCKVSYDLGYEKARRTDTLNYCKGYADAREMYIKHPELVLTDAADKEKSE